MEGAAQVVAALDPQQRVTWWALVPNVRGAGLAVAAGVRHLTVTVSASPMYSEKNVGMSTAESLRQLRSICALDTSIEVDTVVSCVFGSPFGDRVTAQSAAAVCAAARDAGTHRLTLADTTGTATPRRVEGVLQRTGTDVGLHLHDTRGTALTNALHGFQMGVRCFDTSVGGLGGSPFAPGAGGNLPTEQLVMVLDDLGVPTGIDLASLLDIAAQVRDRIGHELPSRVAQSGALPAY
jgi:hydroxymethylglutaryl-CoA lyase